MLGALLAGVGIGGSGCSNEAAPAMGDVLRLVPAGKPIIVCDLDGTIDLGGGLVKELFGRGQGGRPAPGSVEALSELAGSHAIVYLTAREEIFRAESEAFLVREGFPPGPLLMWRASSDPVSRAALKLRCLRRLRAVRSRLEWGFGDRWSDAVAYRRAGLRVALMDPGVDEPVKCVAEGREFVVREWKSIPALVRDPVAGTVAGGAP